MVDLATLKAHCRVQSDSEDVLIATYLGAAVDHLTSIGVDTSSTPVAPAVSHAILLLAGHFYVNREATGPSPGKLIELGVDRLIAPYREVAL